MSEHSAPDFTEITRIQDRAIAEASVGLKEQNAVLIEAPTGAGKTRINSRLQAEVVADFIAEHGRPPKILNLQHRELLARQGMDALDRWAPELDLAVGLALDGNLDQSNDIVYATVQTAAARLDELEKYDIVTIDEAHHASDTKDGDYAVVLDALYAKNPDLKMVAVTATPSRPDNKGLSPHLKNAARVTIGWAELERAGQIKLPRTQVLRVQANDGATVNHAAQKHLAKNGGKTDGLAKVVEKARTEHFLEDMADAWERYSDGRRTIVYAASVPEARAYTKEIESRGHRVSFIDSKASREHNVDTLARYSAGELDMIVSVKMIDEGLDVPSTRCIQILRPTTSEVEYSQMVGRSVRTGDDPEIQRVTPLVLDGGASTLIHGSIENRAATIDYLQKLERGESTDRSLSEVAPEIGGRGEAYTPWRKLRSDPPVLGFTDGQGVVFAIEGRNAEGSPTYTLAEAVTVKGRRQITFMKDENGKALNGIDGTALHRIETERMLPARSSLLRMEATISTTGRTVLDDRLQEASDAHLSTVMHFAKMTGSMKGR